MALNSKTLLRWLIGATVALLLIACAVIFFRDPLLKRAAQEKIQRSTGMRAEIAKFKTGLRTPAISMQGVKLYNHAEFGNTLLLDAPDLLVEFDGELAAQGKLRFKQLHLNLAELNVIRDAAGRWNLDKVETEMTERNAARTKRGETKLQFAGIDELRLSVGRIRFTDFQRSGKTQSYAVNMRDERATGLKDGEALQDWIGEFIFKIILQEAAAPRARRKGKPVETLKEALETQPP